MPNFLLVSNVNPSILMVYLRNGFVHLDQLLDQCSICMVGQMRSYWMMHIELQKKVEILG